MGSEPHDEESPVPELIVRPSVGADVLVIAANLRADDLAEVVAASELTPVQAIGLGYAESRPCFTVEFEGRPAAIFGVVPSPVMERFGTVWMLGTNDIALFHRPFLRQSTEWLNKVTADYDIVGNVVDERNKKHIRWLRWLGFRFIKRYPEYGRLGLPFLEFVKSVEKPASV